jgi:hypothetical protein
MASFLQRAQASDAPVGPPDFEFINIARPKDSASTNLRKAVRSHVMRKYHNRNRARIAGADRNSDQSESTKLLADISIVDRGLGTNYPTISTKEAEHHRAVQAPIRVPSTDPHFIEYNPDPADPDLRNGKTNLELSRSANHNERSLSRLRNLPHAIRAAPTPPFHRASQVDSYSLKLVQFCEFVSNLRSIRA